MYSEDSSEAGRGFQGGEGHRDVFPLALSFPAATKSHVCIQDSAPPLPWPRRALLLEMEWTSTLLYERC